MKLVRTVVVLDAADVGVVSGFWAHFLGGFVVDDDDRFHCVIDAEGKWTIGVQYVPDHTPPQWPDGAPQQVHLDFHVGDADATIERALDAGARPLDRSLDPDEVAEGHQVFADPAGHPFCIGWGHPTAEQLASFLAGYQQA